MRGLSTTMAVLLVACGAGAGGVGAGDPAGDAGPEDAPAGEPDVEGGAGDDVNPAVDTVVEATPPPCNPVLDATGCPDGQNCVFDDIGGILCVDAGDVPIGGVCGGKDAACARGGCLNLGGAGFRCYEYCTKKLHCPPASDCTLLRGRNFGVCKLTPETYRDQRCDLLAQDCKEGQGCYLTGLVDFPICAPAGDGVQGEPCAGGGGCAKGYVCDGNRCARLCGTGEREPGCDEGYECKKPYFDAFLCL